jgi:hypothetical protein
MTTGCLHYPFASGPSTVPRNRKNAIPGKFVNGNTMPVLYHLRELAVERTSLARVMQENPMSLNMLLDELMVALECEVGGHTESELEEAIRFWLRTV